jgi:hypoxanthine phosphoribosyltransferase
VDYEEYMNAWDEVDEGTKHEIKEMITEDITSRLVTVIDEIIDTAVYKAVNVLEILNKEKATSDGNR